jgi:hypothetical protein
MGDISVRTYDESPGDPVRPGGVAGLVRGCRAFQTFGGLKKYAIRRADGFFLKFV